MIEAVAPVVEPAIQPRRERAHPRVEANFMVKVMLGERMVVCKATNLSMAGIFLVGKMGIPGDTLRVKLPLPNDREITTVGRIARVDGQGIALEFEELDWDDMFALARYLHPRLP